MSVSNRLYRIHGECEINNVVCILHDNVLYTITCTNSGEIVIYNITHNKYQCTITSNLNDIIDIHLIESTNTLSFITANQLHYQCISLQSSTAPTHHQCTTRCKLIVSDALESTDDELNNIGYCESNNKLYITSDNGSITTIDLASNYQLSTLNAKHSNIANCISCNDKCIVSGGYDSYIHIYNTSSILQCRIDINKFTPTASYTQPAFITCIDTHIVNNRIYALIGIANGMTVLFDITLLRSPKLLRVLQSNPNNSAIVACRFIQYSATIRYIVTICSNKQIVMWNSDLMLNKQANKYDAQLNKLINGLSGIDWRSKFNWNDERIQQCMPDMNAIICGWKSQFKPNNMQCVYGQHTNTMYIVICATNSNCQIIQIS